MKLSGKKIEGPNEETIVIPRGEGQIVLKARAILDYSEFEALVPAPKAPTITHVGGEVSEDIKDKDFLKLREDYAAKRFRWIILKSLEATPELEWETIKMNDPATWENLEKELTSSGFSVPEVGLIYSGAMAANTLDGDKIKEAKTRFFNMARRGQQV